MGTPARGLRFGTARNAFYGNEIHGHRIKRRQHDP